MARETEQKAVVDAIIDEQLDAKALAEEAYKNGVEASDRIIAMARVIVRAVVRGQLTPAKARARLREALAHLLLLEYAQLVNRMATQTDEHLREQAREIRKYGKALSTIAMIRNVEMKARANERAGAVDKKGHLDGGE